MGWIVQEKGAKGSLKWIQPVVNERPDALEKIVGSDPHN